jgi:hypothetical protein
VPHLKIYIIIHKYNEVLKRILPQSRVLWHTRAWGEVLCALLPSIYSAEANILPVTYFETRAKCKALWHLGWWRRTGTNINRGQKSSSHRRINGSVMAGTTWKCSGVAEQLNLFIRLMLCWPCISIYLCNANQLDALCILSLFRQTTWRTDSQLKSTTRTNYCIYRAVFLNRRAAGRYRALASIVPGRENLSF